MSWNIGAATMRFVGDLTHLRRSSVEAQRIARQTAAAGHIDTRDIRSAQSEIDRLTKRVDELSRAQMRIASMGPVYKSQAADVTRLAASFDRLAASANAAGRATSSTAAGQAARSTASQFQAAAGTTRAATNQMAGDVERSSKRAVTALKAAAVAAAAGAAAYKLSPTVRAKTASTVGPAVSKVESAVRTATTTVGSSVPKVEISDFVGRARSFVADRGIAGTAVAGMKGLDQGTAVLGGLSAAVMGLRKFANQDTERKRQAFIDSGDTRGLKRFDAERRMDLVLKTMERFKDPRLAGANPIQRGISAALGATGTGNLRNQLALSARDRAFEVSRNFKLSTVSRALGPGAIGDNGQISKVGAAGAAAGKVFNIAGGVVVANAFQHAVHWVDQFVRSTVMAGARVKELDVAMVLLGKNSGYSGGLLRNQVEDLTHLGIEYKQAQGAVSQFLKSNLELGKLPQLADVARNAAIFSGEDTSGTLERLIWGIQTRQPEVLRTAGINVSFEREFASLAATLGKTQGELTEADKAQAALNAVLREGKSVAGAYDASMQTASKQMRSTKRYMEELRNEVGQHLEPALAGGVRAFNNLIIGMRPAFASGSTLGAGLDDLASRVKNAFYDMESAADRFTKGGGLQRAIAKVQDVGGKASGAKGIAAAAGAFTGTKFLHGLGDFGQFLVPLRPYQSAAIALIATHKQLAGAFMEIGRSAGQAGSMIASKALPIMEKFESFMTSNADTLTGLGKDIGTLLTANAYGWAGALGMVNKAMTPLLGTTNGLTQALDKTNVLAIGGFIGRSTYMMAQTTQLSGALGQMAGKGLLLKTVFQSRDLFKGLNTLAGNAKSLDDWKNGLTNLTGGIQKAVGAGVTNLSRFSQITSAIGKSSIYAAAGVGLLTAGIQVYGWWSERNAEKTRKLGQEILRNKGIAEDFAASSARVGAGPALTRMVADYNSLRSSAASASAEAKRMNDQLKQLPQSGSMQGALVRGRTISQAGAQAQREAASAAADMAKGLNAARDEKLKQLTEAYKQFNDELGNHSKAMASERKTTGQAVSEGIAAIDASLRTSSAGMVDYSKLTQGQVKNLEDQISELTQSTKNWSEQATSFVAGATRAQVGGLDDLVSHYEEMRSRTAYFWSDLNRLKTQGLSQAAVSDIVAAGPMEMGDALSRMVAELDANGEQAIQGWIKRINESTNAITEMNRQAVRGIAEQILTSKNSQGSVTEAEAASLAKDMAGARDKIKESAGWVGGALDEIRQVMADKGKIKIAGFGELESGDAAAQYATKVQALVAAVQDGTTPLEEVQAKLRDTLSLRDALKGAGDGAVAGVVDNLDTILSTMIGQREDFERAGSTLGVDAGEGLAVSFGHASLAGIYDGLDAAGKAMIEGAQALFDVYGTFKVTAAMAAADLGGEVGPGVDPNALVLPEKLANMLQTNEDNARAAKVAYDDWVNGLNRAPQDDAYAQQQEEQAKASEDAAKAAQDQMKSMEELRQEAEKSYPAMQRVGDAIERVAGISFQNAQFDVADSVEALAKAMVTLRDSSETPAQKQRELARASNAVMTAIQAEAEAAVAAGRVHDDVGSITAYMAEQLAKARGQLPGLADQFRKGAQAAEILNDAIDKARKTLEIGLDVQVNVDEAMASSKEAFYALRQQMDDNRSLLTGRYLGAKERFEIQTTGLRSLTSYVDALKEEATALARSGKIGSDAASIQQHIKDGLEGVKSEYPELTENIDRYIGTLKDAGTAADENSTTVIEAQVDQAMGDLGRFTGALGQIPDVAETLLQIKVDEAALAQAEAMRDKLDDDITPSIKPLWKDAGTPTFDYTPPPGFTPQQVQQEASGAAKQAPAGGTSMAGFIAAKPSAWNAPSGWSSTKVLGAYGKSASYNTGGGNSTDLLMATKKQKDALSDLQRVYRDSAAYTTNYADKSLVAATVVKNTSGALDNLTASVVEQAMAMVDSGQIANDWGSISAYVISQVRDLTRDMPELEGAVNNYASTVQDVPPEWTTNLKADDAVGRERIATYLRDSVAVAKQPATTPVGADASGGRAQIDNYDKWKQWAATPVNTNIYANTQPAREQLAALYRDMRTALANNGKADVLLTNYRAGNATVNDTGGWLDPGVSLLANFTGQKEAILNPRQMEGVNVLLERAGIQGGGLHEALERVAGKGGGGAYVFDEGGWLPPGGGAVASRSSLPSSGLDPALSAQIAHALEGGGQVTIGQMVVHTTDSPKRWIDEGIHRAVNGVVRDG